MTQHRLTHREIVQALVDAIRATLGDIPRGKNAYVAQKILARQCGTLVAGDPAFVAAVRDVVAARVAVGTRRPGPPGRQVPLLRVPEPRLGRGGDADRVHQGTGGGDRGG